MRVRAASASNALGTMRSKACCRATLGRGGRRHTRLAAGPPAFERRVVFICQLLCACGGRRRRGNDKAQLSLFLRIRNRLLGTGIVDDAAAVHNGVSVVGDLTVCVGEVFGVCLGLNQCHQIATLREPVDV